MRFSVVGQLRIAELHRIIRRAKCGDFVKRSDSTPPRAMRTSNFKTRAVCVFGRGRIIDLSRAAARELDMIRVGTTQVNVVRQ
jgi:hypothetical protein